MIFIKTIILLISLLCVTNVMFGQQKLAGKYNAKHQIFIPTDNRYIIDYFNESGVAKFTLKSDFKITEEKKQGIWGLIDTTGIIIIPHIYTNLRIQLDTLVLTTLNGKKGLMHISGKTLIEPIYKKMGEFYCGLSAVQNSEGYGYINTYGKEIVKPYYDLAFDSNKKGFLCVKLNKNYGVLDSLGKVILKPEYHYAFPYKNFILVIQNNQHALFDLHGAKIIDFTDEKLKYLGHTDIICRGKRLYNIKTGTFITEAYSNISYIQETSNTIYEVKKNNKTGLIDFTGKIVVPIMYDDISMFSGEKIVFKLNGKVGFMDFKGTILVPAIYDELSFYYEGVAVARDGKQYYYINERGDRLFTAVGNKRYGFSDGLAKFISGNKYGFINKKGKLVINTIYDWADKFTNGAALVLKDTEYFYIDGHGNKIK